MIMEWNKFGHEDYREIARKAMQKCDGIDGVFGTDQPALYYMHLAMEAGRKVRITLGLLLMMEQISPDFVIRKQPVSART